MKGIVCFLAVFLLFGTVLVGAQPFGPPLYVANPETLECRYYFSGDQKHFNPRPENYTENIGYTTDFKDLGQACSLYRCAKTNGKVLLGNKDDPNLDVCLCQLGFEFVNTTGCTLIQKPAGIPAKGAKSPVPKNAIIFVSVGLLAGFALGIFFGAKFRRKHKNNQ